MPTRRPAPDFFRDSALGQGLAALAMLRDCIERCPQDRWNEPVGLWPYWHVAYHTLCFADLYTAPSNRAWKPHPDFHPAGRKDLSAPSRPFAPRELLAFTDLCAARFRDALAAETPTTLAGACGFSWVKVAHRAEIYPYNTRHVQHHVGQLSAFLRRSGVGPRWAYRKTR